MPYNLLPVPPSNPTDDYETYIIQLPSDEAARAILIGALSFAADDESYQRRGKEKIDDKGMPQIAAFSISTLEAFTMDPVGTLKFLTLSDNNLAPENWLLCDGRAVPISDYPELVDLPVCEQINTLFVRLPDYRGASLRGRPSSAVPSDIVGADEHQLTTAEMPQHSHSYLSRIPSTVIQGELVPAAVTSSAVSTRSTGFAGGGAAHNNVPVTFYSDVWMVAR